MSPECSECERFIALPSSTVKGEILTCPDCGVELEVRATTGGKRGDGILALAPKEKEDWGE